MIENNRRSTTREIAEKLNILHTYVKRHLKQLGYVNKIDIWVPHKLNEIQLTKRISICDSLLKRSETDPFLKRIITIDIKSRYSSKEGYAECLVGLQRYFLF